MNVAVKHLPESQVELTIEISAEEFQKYLDEAYDRINTATEVAGFRKGKTPNAVLEQKVGKEKILAEAMDHLIPDTYYRAIVQEKLSTISKPEIAVKSFGQDQALVYVAKTTVIPDVELSDYKKIKVKREKVEVPAGAEEKILEDLRKRMAKFEEKVEPAAEGDRIEISYKGRIDGKEDARLSSKNHPVVLGEKMFLDDFEKGLIGLKNGEETKIAVRFPKDYRVADFAGRIAEFEVNVEKLQKMIIPEANDEFATKWGAENLADLKKKIGDQLQAEAREDEEIKFGNAVVAEAVKNSKVEIPKMLIDEEVSVMIDELKHSLGHQNLPFEKYLEHLKKTEDEIKEEWRPQAVERVKTALVISKIRDNEGMSASEKEIDEEIEKVSQEQGGIAIDSARAEEIKKNLGTAEGRRHVAAVLANRKTVEKLKEYVSENV